MGARLGFRVLGPLAVTAEGRSVPVGGARQRVILALLILSPGRVVPVDTLVDVVWNGRPPATARTQVAICIAALRKAFKAQGVEDDVIVTAHPGYVLNTEGHDVDWVDFATRVGEAEQEAKEGRLLEAAQHYAQALALWRGPALSGVVGQPVEDEAARLEEYRLNALDDATAVRLDLGQHQEIVPELAAVVREQPLRERTLRHLMLALYRSGRRAEAMEAFRNARKQFIDELGLEPGPDLQQLHDAILRDDSSLDAPGTAPAAPTQTESTVVPSELPPDIPGFIGRDAELAGLDSLVSDGGGGHGPRVGLITGAAGIGKTGLAVRWAHRVHERFPDGRLYAEMRGYDGHHTPTGAGDVLSRFLRSFGVPSDQIPSGLEERTALYRSLLAHRKVLIVLDNVRSYAQIKDLLPGVGECCVVITSREQMEELVTWPPRARVHLGLLAEPEAVGLLAAIVGEPRIAGAPADAATLAGLCDRLPLALRIVAARLASKPHWTVRHMVTRLRDEQRRLDELSQGESQVRASLELSYRYLSDGAASLYRRLGLLTAPDFAAWSASALLDIEALEAERLIEQLVDAQFLEVVGVDATGHMRYRFQNLLRLYAGERAAQEETAEQRWAARDRLFRTYLTLAEDAHRREYGGDFSVLHGTVERCPLDAELTDELLVAPLEWFEAERLSLRAVIDQAAELGMDELAWDLAISMAVLFETRNYIEDWRLCAERALAATRAAGNPRGEAAMLTDLGAVELRLRNLPQAAAYLTEALALHVRVGERHGEALTLRHLAIHDRMQGDLDTAMRRLLTALGVFQAVGDRSSEAHAMNNMAQIELDLGRPEAAIRLGLEAVRLSESIGRGGARGVAQSTHRLGWAYLAQGRPDQAEEAFLRVVHIVKEKSDIVGLAYALLGLGETRLAAGAGQQALDTLTDALDIASRIDSPLVEGQINLAIGGALRALDRPGGEEYLRAAQAIFDRIGARPWQERAAQALNSAAC
ncbi:BTAD domain-containing putative transcriptional regulator [Streptomyces sp. XD-27]|uniref:AfsR/SARP family transcriptional regulator n=1 Tax=Streptomyces sp. XD-27 TaxID=3062779 RepID=UPI0026F43FC2|nr:BTAD domain-containing putative transcriptional regulator [Streptomyces sp. XD-27]WKX69511.1 BTAD domain-containing putative transcriptional regulator [Streptomyces sp. XD-27]